MNNFFEKNNIKKRGNQLSGKKNKSKEAARARRTKESNEFKHLASLLPLQTEITCQLDKASIIRLTISYFNLRNFFANFSLNLNNFTRTNSLEKFDTFNLFHSCLDGFLFLLSEDAKFLYVSEAVSSLLGLSQVVMIGTHFQEYIHPDDYEDIQKYFGITKSNKSSSFSKLASNAINNERKVSFLVRFKSNLLKKNISAKHSGWRLLRIFSKMKCKANDSNKPAGLFGFALGMESEFIHEIPMKYSLIMKLNSNLIIESFERINNSKVHETLTDYLGKSIFHIIHPNDLKKVTDELYQLNKKEHSVFTFQLAISTSFKIYYSNSISFILSSNSNNNSDLFNQSSYLNLGYTESFKSQIVMINEIYEVDISTSFESTDNKLSSTVKPIDDKIGFISKKRIKNFSQNSFINNTNYFKQYDNQSPFKSDSISCSIKTDVTYNNQIIKSAIFQTDCMDHMPNQTMNYYALNYPNY